MRLGPGRLLPGVSWPLRARLHRYLTADADAAAQKALEAEATASAALARELEELQARLAAQMQEAAQRPGDAEGAPSAKPGPPCLTAAAYFAPWGAHRANNGIDCYTSAHLHPTCPVTGQFLCRN